MEKIVIPACFDRLSSGNPETSHGLFGPARLAAKTRPKRKTARKGRSVSVLDLYQFDPD
jgi:hypothetical protein